MAISVSPTTVSSKLQVLTQKLLRPKRSITAWIIFKCSTTFSVPFMDLSPNTMCRDYVGCVLSESRTFTD